MRLDTCVAYTLTAIFTLSLLIVGAEFLYGSGIELQNEEGLIHLAVLLGKEFGTPVYWLFLLGFWSASFTSVLGVFNGVPYLFADLVRHFKKEVPGTKKPAPVSVRDPFYRGFLLWMTFPPMLLLFLEKPVGRCDFVRSSRFLVHAFYLRHIVDFVKFQKIGSGLPEPLVRQCRSDHQSGLVCHPCCHPNHGYGLEEP